MNFGGKKATAALFFLSGLILGGAGGYTISEAGDKPATYKASDQKVDENPLNAKVIEKDKSLPPGTISPSEVTSKITQYKDKVVTLRGLIAESGKDQYSMVDQNSNGSFGIKLDFSKTSAKPADFANTSAKTSNPVTVKGQIIETTTPEGYTVYKLVVESVNK